MSVAGSTGNIELAAPAWQRLSDVEAGDVTPIERLHRYRFHSGVLPLPESRTILVYLPPQYESSPDRRFPVFYLQDGQNLFDPRTSYIPGETWQAHTTADRLALAGEIEPVILVGVANAGERRMAEYTYVRDYQLGGGEGRTYGSLLIDELKPLIDQTYRTLPHAGDTAIGGSSLGGLLSLYLALDHPEIFGKVAVLSPSVWWGQRAILARVSHATPRPPNRIWLDIGTGEGWRHIQDAGMLCRALLWHGWREGVDLSYLLAQGALHDEIAWGARFDKVLQFLFPAQPTG